MCVVVVGRNAGIVGDVGVNAFYAKIHARQERELRKIHSGIPCRLASVGDGAWLVVRQAIGVQHYPIAQPWDAIGEAGARVALSWLDWLIVSAERECV